MKQPLNGYRVCDLTAMISGPLATMQLADQGADVIKIERPGVGDYTRLASNRRAGMSASFLNNNRNKRSVALDIKHPEGLEALKRIAATSDVFVQNFRPGVAERIGIGEQAIRGVAPDIIYVSISGFGENGPYATKPVYDPLVQALSGLASIQGGADTARPRLVRTIVPDKLTGYVAAQAITAALLARTNGGAGQHIRVSMLDAVIDFLWHSDMNSQTFVGDAMAQSEAASFIDLIYETTTDYISVAVQTDDQWHALTEALETPHWRDDPRFATPADRQDHIDARLELTQSRLREASAEYWLERLEEYGVPCAPVLTRSDLIDHPQIRANDILLETEHDIAGRLRQARPAARFSGVEETPVRGAPPLAADTRTVLADVGYDDATIDALIETGAAASADAGGEE
ncbi:CaiB/BaiF CoA transferase family protein [Salinisphaera hydrothermalis]|uniref:L-carnitine dehydratase/bile acid-inducible protein F n=1 Tax=Salinisphaera hydrothermalis (strain C41B8) TaxID=1304275 RepID=A0A084IN36_SALHC|nr:CoA transferase [Salinisphaera hydrothermalis]KEZ78120.1 L-carnitine dehydratase/bile acid-inducible protein F [Salinisphaera hydrothermalis C41B8]